MTYVASRYGFGDATEWDAFVRASRNGTFLVERGFMDYHADRFIDHSLMLRDAAGRLVSVLPANAVGSDVHSHAGLTYGGFIYGPRSGVSDAMALFDAANTCFRSAGFVRMHYKTIPWIYHRQPAEDDRYALFRLDARLSRRDVLAVIPREDRLRFQERRARGVKSARRAGVTVAESGDYATYWRMLEQTLASRHDAKPVHTRDEIELLASRFPGHIRLFMASVANTPAAGVVVFESQRVAHAQYIATTPEGRDAGALDGLFDTLLNQVYVDKAYFDFGISNESQGRVLNVGLVEQKEGFGARCVAHDHYVVELGGTQ